MAARKQLWHDDVTKQKIKTSQLINRLQEHALSPEPILYPSQVRSIEILLKKVIPDLAAVQHSGEVTTFVADVPRVTETTGEWLSEVSSTAH